MAEGMAEEAARLLERVRVCQHAVLGAEHPDLRKTDALLLRARPCETGVSSAAEEIG